MNEMGFQIARKHAAKLRRTTIILGVALPVPLLALSFTIGGGAVATLLTLLGLLSLLAALLIERWLFFAEARHTVMLYYGG